MRIISEVNVDDTDYLVEMCYEYNCNGELCKHDAHGYLIPVGDRGIRMYPPRLSCPEGVDTEV